jgi:DNA repair exonuclease SbcCD nuclease subunit
MSKILLIGDVHLGMSYPNNYNKWFGVAKEYFKDFLIPFVKKNLCKDDIIVQLGDLFDNRNYIPIDILNYGQSILEELSDICKVHVLVGNHDMHNKSDGELNSLKAFRHIPNVFIYEKPQKIEFCGKTILMLPYYEKRLEQIEVLRKYTGCDYLFCHSDLNGAKMHLTSAAHRNMDKIDETDFTGYKNVKTGHIHIRQTIGNITFVGSIFQMDRNDLGDQKGIYLIDTKSDKEIFIENKISPVFRKFKVVDEKSVDELDKLMGSKDYIDLSISNTLLISNRKLRRKLEIMLENGNFASVEYIDDIIRVDDNGETVVESVTTEDGVIDISIELEYEKYIRDYIEKQKYDSDKFKTGILKEFDDILKIYSDNYLKS